MIPSHQLVNQKKTAEEKLYQLQQDSLKKFNEAFYRQLNLLEQQLIASNNERNYQLEKAKFDSAIIQNINSITESRNREIDHEFYTNQMEYFFKAIQSVTSLIDLPYNSKEYNEERHNLFLANGTLMLLNDTNVVKQFEEFKNHVRFYEMFNQVIFNCDSLIRINTSQFDRLFKFIMNSENNNSKSIPENEIFTYSSTTMNNNLNRLSEYISKMDRDTLIFTNNNDKAIFIHSVSGLVIKFTESEDEYLRLINEILHIYEQPIVKNKTNKDLVVKGLGLNYNATSHRIIVEMQEYYEIFIKNLDRERDFLKDSSKRLAGAMSSANKYTKEHN